MRILYHHRILSRDGQSVHLEELVAALRSDGHEVLIVGPKSFARSSFGHDPRILATIKKLVPRAVYELLELGYNVPAYLRLRSAFLRYRPDFIYERYNLGLMAGVWLKRRFGVPLLLEVNAPLARERTVHNGLGLPRLAARIEKATWRAASGVLAVTNVLAREICASGVTADQVVVIPNAINLESFTGTNESLDERQRLGLVGKTIIGFAGFVRTWHGLDAVVDWLASPNISRAAHLLLLGDGPALPDLIAQAKSLGVSDRVTFVGLVGRDDMAKMLATFDIAIQPKCVEYCSPLKLFEYMGMAKAIIAPDQANIREVLTNEDTALLFDPADSQSMVSAIEKLIADPNLCNRLGANARQRINTGNFIWANNASRVSHLALSLLPAKSDCAKP